MCGSGNPRGPTAEDKSETPEFGFGGWGSRIGHLAPSPLGWNGCAQRFGRGVKEGKSSRG
jgi:hypothetical protein